MEKGQSVIEYLVTYGWMILVVAIVGGAIFSTMQSQGENDPKINATQVSNFLEERTGYTNCTVELGYDKTEADATCTRSIGEQGNMSFKGGKKFTAELRNGSIVIFSDYNY